MSSQKKNIFSRNNANISRNNANISRYNANFSRNNANISRNNANISRNNANISRYNANISRNNANISRNNANISRYNANFSRNNANISRNNANISRNNPNISRYNANYSRNNANISRNNANISRNNANVSFITRIVSHTLSVHRFFTIMDKDELVRFYFELGLSNAEIMCFLAMAHNVIISISTLKRVLKRLRLSRRKNYSDLCDVAVFILNELQQSGQLHGYRWLHSKCVQAGFTVPRDVVYNLLKILDPIGILGRKRRRLHRRQYISNGPDHVWHVDSYDKLKPYGIAINGCIDGYSRNMICLEAYVTNNDPKVIADYYIKAVQQRKGCPQRVRADMGTENVYIEQMQRFFRRNHDDDLAGDKSFLYGKSTHNQRIEWFWGILRKEVGQFWMNLFSNFTDDIGDTVFCGTFLDKSLVQFCFMNVVQVKT